MANEELKQRQSVMWANGPYEKVGDTLAGLCCSIARTSSSRARGVE